MKNVNYTSVKTDAFDITNTFLNINNVRYQLELHSKRRKEKSITYKILFTAKFFIKDTVKKCFLSKDNFVSLFDQCVPAGKPTLL